MAAIHSPESLRAALLLEKGVVDLLELRVDCFAGDPAALLEAAPKFRVPLIITVRHPAEGGQNTLSPAQRRALYAEFLPWAACVDIELRSVKSLAGTLAEARNRGIRIILSAHDFKKTPSSARLKDWVRRMRQAGADVCKIATRTEGPDEIARLLALFASSPRAPLAAMGMGRFGKVSRLLFAQAGSILNFGYLARANAPGQWPVERLRRVLAELAE